MMRPSLDDATVDERVGGRLTRQEFFTRRPTPLATFVIDNPSSRGRSADARCFADSRSTMAAP